MKIPIGELLQGPKSYSSGDLNNGNNNDNNQ